MLHHPILAPLTSEERQAFFRGCSLITLKKNQTLLEVGSEHANYYIVAAGVVRLESFSSTTGELVTCSLEKVHALLGEVTLEDRYTSTLAASAVMECSVFAVPIARLRALIQSHPAVGIALVTHLGMLAQRLRKQVGRLNHASPEIAVGKSMYELGTALNGTSTGQRLMDKRVTQGQVGAAVGLSREQVNKTMKNLEAKGLVTKTESGYVVDKLFAATDYSMLVANPPSGS